MLKKTINFTDYNGEKRTEDFYFNLNKAELMEMELRADGGLSATLQKMVNQRDRNKLMDWFKDIILMSYGEKTDDGRRFVKSEELSKEFSQTEAYTELFMELLSGDDTATRMADFIKGVLPADMAAEMDKVDINSLPGTVG
ncbi:MAG: hypothetical protein LUF78_10820 [Clostridiales bacterium]|nr:hypothetical protein [Clostridiales bacterium]